jgi:hypothetical protein
MDTRERERERERERSSRETHTHEMNEGLEEHRALPCPWLALIICAACHLSTTSKWQQI